MSAIARLSRRSPNVYMPQYGGYDPLGVAHGVAVAGNPNMWLIAGERLFLFYDDARRDKFAADPDRVIGSADRKWPEVLRDAHAVSRIARGDESRDQELAACRSEAASRRARRHRRRPL